MKAICLYFEIHQIIHLKRYRFFEIGTDHYYYDDYANEPPYSSRRRTVPKLKTPPHSAPTVQQEGIKDIKIVCNNTYRLLFLL